jgi:hypothetical protein
VKGEGGEGGGGEGGGRGREEGGRGREGGGGEGGGEGVKIMSEIKIKLKKGGFQYKKAAKLVPVGVFYL